mgnify:CR=1 FL=1
MNPKFINLATKAQIEGRYSFTGCYIPDPHQILIHGGLSEAGELRSFAQLDLMTLVWKELSIETADPISGHSGVQLEGNFVLFGGWRGSSYSDKLVVYHRDGLIEERNRTSGEWGLPSARNHHTLTLANNCLYLLGGWDSLKWNNSNTSFAQLWRLKSNWEWELCDVFGKQPISRRGHSTSYFPQSNCLVVYGGMYGYSRLLSSLYILDLNEMLWIKVGNFTKRAWHSASCLDKFIYIFGGYTESGISNDLQRFNVEERTCDFIEVQSKPSPRCGHISLSVEGFILILGGKDEDSIFNDVYVLDVQDKYQELRQKFETKEKVQKELDSLDIAPPPIPPNLLKSRFFTPSQKFNPKDLM